MRAALKRDVVVVQPVRIRIRIVIYIGNNLTPCVFPSGVSRRAETLILSAYEIHIEPLGDLGCVIRGTIIDNNDFVVGIVESAQVFQAFADCTRAVVAAYDHGKEKLRLPWWKGAFQERPSDRSQRRLWPAKSIRQAEFPVRDFGTAAVPFIGP